MMASLSVALGLMVFLWSRRLWGEWGGLLSLTLYVFSPTSLAHGPLVTSDTTAALALLLAVGAFWRHLRQPGWKSLGLSLAATGFAAVSKFSFLLLAPIFLGLGLWHLALSESGGRGRVFARLLGLACAQALGAALVVWMAFGFRYSIQNPGLPPLEQYYIAWEKMVPAQGARAFVLNFLRDHRVLPEAFLAGMAHVLHASEARGAFAAGQHSSTGWWWFFPYGFLIKSSLAELGAVLATLATGVWLLLRDGKTSAGRLLARCAPVAPLLALVAVYWTAALGSNLNIGHRHLIPIYPPLFILAGMLAGPRLTRLWKIGAGGLAALAAAECAHTHPNHLAYFNALVGGSSQGWRHLADSSLDWGQELPALHRWLEANRRADETVYLSYFGLGNPAYEGIQAEDFAPIMPPWRLRYLNRFSPGLYCVSATMLQDVYGRWRGPWTGPKENSFLQLHAYFSAHPEEFGSPDGLILASGDAAQRKRWLYDQGRFARLCTYLRLRAPDAVINHSMFVYRLDARETALAGDATSAEFSAMLEAADTRPAIKARP